MKQSLVNRIVTEEYLDTTKETYEIDANMAVSYVAKLEWVQYIQRKLMCSDAKELYRIRAHLWEMHHLAREILAQPLRQSCSPATDQLFVTIMIALRRWCRFQTIAKYLRLEWVSIMIKYIDLLKLVYPNALQIGPTLVASRLALGKFLHGLLVGRRPNRGRKLGWESGDTTLYLPPSLW